MQKQKSFTDDLVEQLDKELHAIHFPGVTFVPKTNKEQREKELELMMERNDGNNRN